MQTEPQKCTAMATAVNVNQLPEIAEGTCAETSRTFSITRAEDGSLTLTVSQPVTPESDQTGQHVIPAAQLETQGENTGVVQVYVGPTEFDLEP